MNSPILKQDHDALIKLNRSLSPEERLMAFFNHSQLLTQLSLARVVDGNSNQSSGPTTDNPPLSKL